jgi:DNA polymerase III delta prime subunit
MEKRAPTMEVDKQLREIRNSLLDLTMRNRALNFRPTRARTIRVIDEIPAEVYDYLVLKERAMEFRARPAGITTESLEADEAERLDDETASLLWRMPTSELAERHTDRFLQTPLESAALQQRLFKVSQQARTILNEQGYTALHLILGFLEWTDETPTPTARRAPLILIPVELERTRAGAAFKLRWTKEDLRTNISLQARLLEQSVRLPDFEMTDDKVGVDWYLESVVLAVSGKRGWRVVTDIYLDFISFTKFVLYKDLDPAAWPDRSPPAHHPLVRAILSPGGLEKFGAAAHVSDDALPAHSLYTVLDADSSQAEVIEAARRGANLVVEGPPGTGKSQTIVNLIAELMASGKTILFVSEKAAALQVVKERINKIGLGDFCLELHSRKANKREVLMELEATVYRQPPLASPAPGDDNEYETLKAELNNYACALRAPCGRIPLSVFALYCLRERARRHFTAVGRAMPRVKLAGVEDCDQQQWLDALMKLAALGQMLAAIRPLATHPWRGCDPDAVMPSDEYEVALLIKRCRANLEHLLTCLQKLTAICAMQPIANVEQTAGALSAAKLIVVTQSTSHRVMLNQAWKNPGEPVKALIAELQQTQRELEEAAGVYRAHALDEDIAGLLAEYQYLSTKRLRFFLPRYHRLRRAVAGLYRGTPPLAPQLITNLRHLADTLRRRNYLQRGSSEGSALFGPLWQGEQSDVGALREFAEWVFAVRRCIGDNVFADEVTDLIEAGVAGAEIEQAAASVSDAVMRFKQAREALNQRLRIADEEVFSARTDLVTFSAFAEQLDIWQSEIARLQRWAQYRALVRDLMKTIATPLLESIAGDQIDPEDVVECFKGNFADDLLRTAFATRPELAGFVGDLHESKMDRFSELGCRLIQANRQRLAEKLYAARPQLLGGASPSSEAGMLLGEFARKRRLMPIRKLMLHAGALVQRFKPCFMMSPLSVAQFLDPAGVRFDVVVFDEASQVKIEDALGALLRASQCIVLGDTRQLPPTSFFDSLIESGDGGEADAQARISDVESLLHQCKMIFDVRSLHWHYRSQHESLIAVSNQEFYNNRLVIHPSPEQRPEWLGLHFVHLPETVYALSASLQITATARSADESRHAPVKTRLLEEAVALYQTCSSLTIPVYGELHDQPVERLAEAVTQVVAVEGPVHLEEAIRRIRSLWGVKRAGQRIQQAINRAVYFAELNGGVQRRGAFLWPTTEHEVAVRRRQGDPPPRIDLICDEEIAAAVRLVLKHQFATIFDDLVIRCLRLFGIQGMSGLAATRIRSIVMRMIESGQVQRRADGRIRLTSGL